MTLDKQLLEIVRCPACRGVFADPAGDELTCTGCGRAYPIRNGVPLLLVDEARETPGQQTPGQQTPEQHG